MPSSSPPEGHARTVWRARIRISRHGAEIANTRLVALPELAEAVLTSFEDKDDQRQIEIYLTAPPGAVLESLLAEIFGRRVTFEPLPETDWLSRSQEGLTPFKAGRFYITPDATDRHGPRRYRITVGAGLAFGTGHHETTRGCLLAIDRLLKQSVPGKALDLGCGTGILAMALAKAGAREVVACDNDPAAVRVARENRRRNRIPRERMPVVLADRLTHPALRQRFDVIVANILARPLIDKAPALIHLVAPGGTIVLSGILRKQQREVLAAYRRGGLVCRQRFSLGEWSTLVLAKPRGFSLGIDRGEID